MTNSYSAEFGKASGGVVNIVTKSGTNTAERATRSSSSATTALNAKKLFRAASTPAGNPIDREKAPFGQKQFGGTFGGPIKRDWTFFFGSFERLDVETNNFVTIDDTTRVTAVRATALGTAAAVLRAAGFPVETGNVPYVATSNQFLAKIDHQITQNQTSACASTTPTRLNENIEPWGGMVARSRARSLDSKDHMFAASHTSVSGSSWSTSSLPVRAPRSERQLARSQLRRPVHQRTAGRPDPRGPRRASVGRQRFTPQPRLNCPVPGDRHSQPFRGQSSVEGGLRLQLHRQHKMQALPLHFGGRYLFAAASGALPDCRARADHRHSGVGARAARGVYPGLRQFPRRPTDTAISRSSRRTTGASPPSSR